MGFCSFKRNLSEEEELQIKKSAAIDKQLKTDWREEKCSIKLLLLGSAESGKSTVLKQFKLIYGTGFTSVDLMTYRSAIMGNVVASMKALIQGSIDFAILVHVKDSKEKMAMIMDLPYVFMNTAGQEMISSEVLKAMETLWADPGIQMCYQRSHEFQLPDSCAYFMNKVREICSPNYTITNDDALRVRIMTTTITESKFNINGAIYRVIDVGGQRSERRKWIHYFDDVRAVLFVSAVGSYDQTISEDRSTNRMIEALDVFQKVANSSALSNTAFLVFLNKIDLLEEKLSNPSKPFNKFFPDFQGQPSLDAVRNYFVGRFKMVNKNPDRPLYFYVTTATDTQQTIITLKVVADIVMQTNLRECEL
ncbi:guanine nucleotide-binding protein G(o) subunit alpha [Polychytrium aggregatum]|uniref:guanine nucleotide-binding protein G(o) subunit alpha n=1 Tax=Polychytrium aggregatum TaxID=110093 RepID=UPI0022FF28CF|nr:guanine nucleotide-binding protein G(o) subunit alpha [Polychytrium aggregatum]KAI9206281.1 guanine nucleotide-binding protein G(o) subunit alpha [Polychytrium aggregatum]